MLTNRRELPKSFPAPDDPAKVRIGFREARGNQPPRAFRISNVDSPTESTVLIDLC
jgi:hypothetical protein